MSFSKLFWITSFTCLIGCSDSDTKGNVECGPGETYNPITGLCDSGRVNNGLPDAGNNGDNNGNNGTSNNGTNNGQNNGTIAPDMGDVGGERCNGGDNDGDGLTNACECTLATDLENPDTDGDGLSDFEEDANQNCELDIGIETDPRQADTDFDGANDFEEAAAGTNPILQDTDGDLLLDGVEIAGCTDPLVTDTDADGLPDSVEDANLDGELGVCVNRVFDPVCAQGESDPCKADTDGDGTPDSDEAQYRACRPEDSANLPVANVVLGNVADYQFVIESGVNAVPVTNYDAHVFEDVANGYTGFVVSIDPGNLDNPSLVSDAITGSVQSIYPAAVRRVTGRRITSHDGYKAAVGGLTDLPAGTSLHTARDQILAEILGVANVTHGLTSTFAGDATETLFVTEVLSRSANQAVVIGAFVTLTDYQNDSGLSGIRVDDLTKGAALALASETEEPDCVSYDITARPQVDIIISLDASGSMTDEQAALANFATEFTTLLNNANLDWRIGVTGVNCSNIRNDAGLSAEFKALWGAGGMFGSCATPIGIGSGGNGKLEGGNFVTETTPNAASVIAGRLNGVNTTASEFTLTMGLAAIDRALPRAVNSPNKFREDAAIIVIAVTDEEDEFFKTELGLPDVSVLSAADQATLEAAGQPWIDWALQPTIGATVFGLYSPPGETCATASDVAHSVGLLVTETGGAGGSICQVDITNTLGEIANATAGIASGLRLRGVPLTPTLGVIHGNAITGTISPILRSRTDGFDFDPIVNRIAFVGPMLPQTNDRVVIPYRRWAGSVNLCVNDSECPPEQKQRCIDGACL